MVPTATADISADDLNGNAYESTEVTGHELRRGHHHHLIFEDDDLSVAGGLQHYERRVRPRRHPPGLVRRAGGTMMACSDELTAQDAWLTALFTEGVDAALEDDVLTLTHDDETIKLSAQ